MSQQYTLHSPSFPQTRCSQAFRIGTGVLLCILTAQSIHFFTSVTSISVWRHDALHNVSGFEEKLRNEGRWLIYFLFHALRRVPPGVHWVACMVFHGFFFAAVAAPVVRDRRVALAFSLVCMQIPALQAFALWPAQSSLGGLLLALAALARHRIPAGPLLIGFAVLLFGTFQHYPLFLPFLFLGPGPNGSYSMRDRIRQCICWGAGIVLGYAVSLAIVYAVTGQIGIEPAAWRQARVAGSAGAYITNLLGYGPTAWRDLATVFMGMTGFATWCVLLGLRFRNNKSADTLVSMVICLLVVGSFYILIAKIGAPIAGRTTIPVVVGVLALASLSTPQSIGQSFAVVLGLFIFFQLYIGVNRDNLRWYTSVTETWLNDLNELSGLATSQPPRLMVIGGNARSYQQRIESELDLPTPRVMSRVLSRTGVDYDNLWVSYARASRFSEVILCHEAGESRCEVFRGSFKENHCLNDHPNLCLLSLDFDGFMVIHLK